MQNIGTNIGNSILLLAVILCLSGCNASLTQEEEVLSQGEQPATPLLLEEQEESQGEVGATTEVETEDIEDVDDVEDRDKIEDELSEDAITYEFLDVHGESYTAVLLEDIPMHSYDYSQLHTDSTLYTYEDEDGEITSRVGIDVSKYQGDIDWQAVKDAGIEFAMIRLGYRGYSEEGNLAVDEYYEQNMTEAISVGLDVGVYFFSQAITEEEALEEAEFVLEHMEGYSLTMPVVFDTERIELEEARTFDLDGQIFTDACVVFCDRIEEEGYDSMIYFNLLWSALTLDLEQLVEYDKWYADYYDEPQYPYAFEMWQYTESATIPGVEGNVDLNIVFR